MAKKRKNQVDATLRNVRASRLANRRILLRLRLLEARVTTLERRR